MSALPPPRLPVGVHRCRSKAPDGVTRCELARAHKTTHLAKWADGRGLDGYLAWMGGGKTKPATWWEPKTGMMLSAFRMRVGLQEKARRPRRGK